MVGVEDIPTIVTGRSGRRGRLPKADIPYSFRPNRVTDERTLHSYYLREHVDVAEQECRHDVQQQLGEEVPKGVLLNMRPRAEDTMSRQEQEVDESFVERVDRIIDREWAILDRLPDRFWYDV
jgi:hypothetical protein